MIKVSTKNFEFNTTYLEESGNKGESNKIPCSIIHHKSVESLPGETTNDN